MQESVLRVQAEYREEKLFQEMISKMDPEKASEWIKDRQKYELDERRHRELCSAIRASGTNVTVRNTYY